MSIPTTYKETVALMDTFEPNCPKCGASDWDTYAGRDAHHRSGFSMVCGKCWEFAIHLTHEQLLRAVMATDKP